MNYDVRGNLASQSYFGQNGKPVLSQDGYASFRQEYNADGLLTQIEYFDSDGKRTIQNWVMQQSVMSTPRPF